MVTWFIAMSILTNQSAHVRHGSRTSLVRIYNAEQLVQLICKAIRAPVQFDQLICIMRGEKSPLPGITFHIASFLMFGL